MWQYITRQISGNTCKEVSQQCQHSALKLHPLWSIRNLLWRKFNSLLQCLEIWGHNPFFQNQVTYPPSPYYASEHHYGLKRWLARTINIWYDKSEYFSHHRPINFSHYEALQYSGNVSYQHHLGTEGRSPLHPYDGDTAANIGQRLITGRGLVVFYRIMSWWWLAWNSENLQCREASNLCWSAVISMYFKFLAMRVLYHSIDLMWFIY